MNDSTRLVIALLLVTSPLYAPVFDVTGHDYEYESTRVVVENDSIRVVNDSELSLFYDGVEGIDCLYERRVSRGCVHEAGLLNGTRQADHPTILDLNGGVHFAAQSQYVAFMGDSAVYERTAYWRDGNYVLGLVQVSPEQVLDDVATDTAYVSPQAMTAIEEGSVRTNEPLSDTNEIVKTEAGYFLVYEEGRKQFLDADPKRERLLEWVAVLFGAFLLRRTD